MDEFPLYRALLSANPDLTNFDDRQYGFHETPALVDRVSRRLRRSALAGLFNRDIQRAISIVKPSIFIAFKATHLSEETINIAKAVGAKCIMIYPDLDPTIHGSGYLAALRAADHFYFTKPNLVTEFVKRVRPNAEFIFPFYSRLEVNSPLCANPSVGVSFVGHYSAGKCKDLLCFRDRLNTPMTIVGSGWGHVTTMFNSEQPTRVMEPIYGKAIRDIYRSSICSLGLLMEPLSDKWAGDEITSRSVLVPASGGILVHPRNPSSEYLYGKDSAGLYETTNEAVRIIEQWWQDPDKRMNDANLQQGAVLARATCAEDFAYNLLK